MGIPLGTTSMGLSKTHKPCESSYSSLKLKSTGTRLVCRHSSNAFILQNLEWQVDPSAVSIPAGN